MFRRRSVKPVQSESSSSNEGSAGGCPPSTTRTVLPPIVGGPLVASGGTGKSGGKSSTLQRQAAKLFRRGSEYLRSHRVGDSSLMTANSKKPLPKLPSWFLKPKTNKVSPQNPVAKPAADTTDTSKLERNYNEANLYKHKARECNTAATAVPLPAITKTSTIPASQSYAWLDNCQKELVDVASGDSIGATTNVTQFTMSDTSATSPTKTAYSAATQISPLEVLQSLFPGLDFNSLPLRKDEDLITRSQMPRLVTILEEEENSDDETVSYLDELIPSVSEVNIQGGFELKDTDSFSVIVEDSSSCYYSDDFESYTSD